MHPGLLVTFALHQQAWEGHCRKSFASWFLGPYTVGHASIQMAPATGSVLQQAAILAPAQAVVCSVSGEKASAKVFSLVPDRAPSKKPQCLHRIFASQQPTVPSLARSGSQSHMIYQNFKSGCHSSVCSFFIFQLVSAVRMSYSSNPIRGQQIYFKLDQFKSLQFPLLDLIWMVTIITKEISLVWKKLCVPPSQLLLQYYPSHRK